MKHGWVVLLLLAGVIAPRTAKAQAAVYGDFSISDLTNLVQTDLLSGATVGVLAGNAAAGSHLVIQGNIQGRFVTKSGESLNGLTIGPRFEFPMKRHGLTPYAEFMVGFARYHGTYMGVTASSTDATMQANGGVAKQFSPHWDGDLQYSYAQYYGNGGEFNPKTFSIGVIYHFVKR